MTQKGKMLMTFKTYSSEIPDVFWGDRWGTKKENSVNWVLLKEKENGNYHQIMTIGSLSSGTLPLSKSSPQLALEQCEG